MPRWHTLRNNYIYRVRSSPDKICNIHAINVQNVGMSMMVATKGVAHSRRSHEYADC